MSYVKTTWTTGDVITAEKLNNLEDGVDAGGAFIINFVVEFDEYGNPTATADKTYEEAIAAYNAGKVVLGFLDLGDGYSNAIRLQTVIDEGDWGMMRFMYQYVTAVGIYVIYIGISTNDYIEASALDIETVARVYTVTTEMGVQPHLTYDNYEYITLYAGINVYFYTTDPTGHFHIPLNVKKFGVDNGTYTIELEGETANFDLVASSGDAFLAVTVPIG